MGVRPNRDAECPGEAEVGKLDVAVLVDEQVLRLQIAVEDPVRVAELDPGEELPHVALGCFAETTGQGTANDTDTGGWVSTSTH